MARIQRRHRASRRTTALVGAASAAALAAGGLAAVSGGAQAADVNLVGNGGFEAGSLSGWTCSGGSGSVVGAPVHSGSYALQATPTGSDTAQCSQTVSVQPNSSYSLKAWVQGQYAYLGASGTGGNDPSTWSSNSDWNQLSTSFTTGASTTSVTIYTHGWYGQGAYSADDVTLAGPGGSSASPTASASASAGTSASPTPSPSPTGTGGASPGFRVAPYLDASFGKDLSQIASASGQKNFTLAFLNSNGGCQASMAGGDASANISSLRAAGGDALVSSGGWNADDLARRCTDAAGLASAYQQVIDAYRLTAIDFDVEKGDQQDNLTDHAMADRRSAAIKILQQNAASAGRTLTVSFTLGVLPESGLNDDNLYIVKSAVNAGVRVDLVNIMTMDYYENNGGAMGDRAGQAAQKVHDQLAQIFTGTSDADLWARIGITPMIGQNDDPNEVFTVADANTVLAFAKQHHVGRLAFWSVGRDQQGCAGGGASASCSGINSQPYDFTKVFEQYTG